MPTSSTADAAGSFVNTRLPPGPYSSGDPVASLAHYFERALEGAGVRLLPYPFDSAIAVASDIDGSGRETFTGYTRMLIHDLGLDFGDSVWLHWRYVFNAHGRAVTSNSVGFLSPSLTEQTGDAPKFFRNNPNFREVLAEYHEGNFDHFHALLPHGPRIAVLTDVSRTGALLTAEIPAIDVSCADFHVFGICFVCSGQADPGIESVRVELTDGEDTIVYQPSEHDHPADGNSYFLFVRQVHPDDADAVPHLRKVARIVAETADPTGPMPTRVILLSTYGPLLLDRLNFLREKYNVEMPLVTEHAKLHFRYPLATEWVRARNTGLYETQADALYAFNGPLVDSSGNVIATVDADEPHSFARVLPEAVDDAELRFIVPEPASKTDGFHVTELLAQSPTRSGGGIYWAKRTMPNISTPEPGQVFDGKTRQNTFAARVQRAIDGSMDDPGTFWPIYTHLGALDRIDGQRIVPDPYFEPGPLLTLQDRAFGITADVPAGGRIWFARASTLYDYALVLHAIAEHIERDDAGSIGIRSWHDPVLGKTLPRAPSQLYGVTFYVEDEADATVALDGEIIEHVTRNPADSSGAPSITIAECDISATLFRAVDPRTGPGTALENGEWEWQDGGSPHGRLVAGCRGTAAKLRVPIHGTMLPGSQLLGFRLRAGADWAGGVLLETRSGGRFWFGAGVPADDLGEMTAIYAIDRLLKPDAWLRVVVPFYDLVWSSDARPGGPLPSHALEAVTLVSAGPTGSAAEFGDMRLLRPRVSLAARYPGAGHCVIGFVAEAGEGETVQLCPRGKPENATIAHTDQLGWFAFTAVAPGVYDITASKDGVRYRSARGATVEVWSDIPRLALTETI